MLDFAFSESQELLRVSLQKFGRERIAPRIKEMVDTCQIPHDLVSELADIGLLAMSISPSYGGSGLEAVSAGIVAEELGKADGGCALPTFFLVQNAWSYILDKYGSEELKSELLPLVRRGQAFLGIGITEPEAGSDVASMKTQIKKGESGYLVIGEKCFISGVRETQDYGGGFVTLAKMSVDKGTRGMTMFFLPAKGTAGFQPYYLEELGREGISWGGFYLDNVAIPEHYLLGDENRGFYIVHEGFDFARTLIALVCVGAAFSALENAVNYMKERKTFGRALASYEGLQFTLADDHAKLEAVRLLAYRALWLYEREQRQQGSVSRFDVSKAVAMAKMLAPLWAFDAINHAMQWQGAFGYSKECPEQRALRGVRSYTLAEGTTEVMKLIIAREVLGREFLSS